MKYILTAVFLSFFLISYCQVSIFEESKISLIMQSYVNQNRSTENVQGWRIQLITTNDRRKMETVRSQFNALHPEVETSWKHISPYYYVQTGAYRTKLELQSFLLMLKDDFPNAIPVMDKIKKTELLK